MTNNLSKPIAQRILKKLEAANKIAEDNGFCTCRRISALIDEAIDLLKMDEEMTTDKFAPQSSVKRS